MIETKSILVSTDYRKLHTWPTNRCTQPVSLDIGFQTNDGWAEGSLDILSAACGHTCIADMWADPMWVADSLYR